MGKPQLCLPQPSLQRALKERSPRLSLNPFHPSKRATSSRMQEHLTCLSPTTSVLLPSCGQGWPRVHGKHSIKEQSKNTLETAHSGNFNASAFFCLVFMIPVTPTAWPSSSDRLRICACAGQSQGCGCHPALRRILTAHVEEILVVVEGGSQFDTTGRKFC